MHGDVVLDGGDQFWNAAKDAALESVGRDTAEEAFAHVEPRCRGRREVHVEARVLGEPFLNDWMLVCGVVVGDQMQGLVLGRLAVDLLRISRHRDR